VNFSHRFINPKLHVRLQYLWNLSAAGPPACQLPTDSSPCTSLSANSSIMLRSYSSMVSILSPSMPAMAGHPG
jgi:hypothetical protein